jgi:cellulose synthase/poly-beta-1,6-N-acetylglucosamine synthase-like glycosyltransferase
MRNKNMSKNLVVIPAYNEEETIEAAVENLPQKPTRDKVQRMTRGSQYKICNRKL